MEHMYCSTQQRTLVLQECYDFVCYYWCVIGPYPVGLFMVNQLLYYYYYYLSKLWLLNSPAYSCMSLISLCLTVNFHGHCSVKFMCCKYDTFRQSTNGVAILSHIYEWDWHAKCSAWFGLYESLKQVYTNVGVQTDITVVSYKLYKCLLLRMQMIRYSQAPSEAIPMFSC